VIATIGERATGFDDVGTGMPVVFIHGFPHHRGLWAPQLDALARRARCIAPDLAGFGESAPRPSPSVDTYADDVVALLDVLEIDRAVIAGLSMGGYVALALWRRHAARCHALVLADTRAGADDEAGRAKRRDMIALARSKGADGVAEAMLPGMVGKSTRERSPELVAQVDTMLRAAPVEGIVGALEAMMARPDATPTLAGIRVPTLVVVGSEDVLTPPSAARALADAIPGARLETIDGAGHVSNLERPAAFNYVLGEFLERADWA
jgi:3-oxoadipate enol-lactonase